MSELLRVRTFGSFSISYKDKLINGRNKSNESRFIYLMQILLHAGEAGVSKQDLEQALFYNSDLKNVHHSTQSVIYNAKKHLLAQGLPDVNFIEPRHGV